MSRANAQMPSARRRPIPGMTSAATAAPASPAKGLHGGGATDLAAAVVVPAAKPDLPLSDSAAREAASGSGPGLPRSGADRRPARASSTNSVGVASRRPSRDYASTRLVNFRIPVDLHDRYKRLVRDVEQTHLRLRHPSLTEVLIGLLEEGPDTADEIAAVIRRKRAAEHGTEDNA